MKTAFCSAMAYSKITGKKMALGGQLDRTPPTVQLWRVLKLRIKNARYKTQTDQPWLVLKLKQQKFGR